MSSNQINPKDFERNLYKVSLHPEEVSTFCRKYPIRKLALFGSILREDFSDSSDIDILVELSPDARVGYFELIRMEDELTTLLGRKVDLRTPQELSSHFRQTVIDEAVTQYVKD